MKITGQLSLWKSNWGNNAFPPLHRKVINWPKHLQLSNGVSQGVIHFFTVTPKKPGRTVKCHGYQQWALVTYDSGSKSGKQFTGLADLEKLPIHGVYL